MRTKKSEARDLIYAIAHLMRRSCEYEHVSVDEAALCLTVMRMRSNTKFTLKVVEEKEQA